jgi:hypothetical protein
VLEGVTSAADCHQLLAHILTARRPENSSHSSKLAKKPPLPLYFPLPLPCGLLESTHSGWDWRLTAAKESWTDPRLSGKWLLFEHHFGGTAGLLKAWRALLDAFETGRLGITMKISDVGQRTSGSVVCVYTPNHRDTYDVLRVLLTLRRVLGVRGGGSKASAFGGEGVIHISCLEAVHDWDGRAQRAVEAFALQEEQHEHF